MWVLVQETTGKIFPMFPNIQYNVGRLTADLVLNDDKSISGAHAHLTGKKTDSGINFLELKDAGSKNGTFINGAIKNRKPIKKNLPIELRDGDRVQFGLMGNSWLVHYQKFCIVSSGLTFEENEELKLLLENCGGKQFSTFDKNSTHLTMKEIKVTLKVMHALLTGIPIVNIDFWQDLLKIASKEKKGPMPAIENYLPRITDVLLAQQDVDFRIRQERKSVFAGKTFVFLSQKHYETYSPIVEKAGGCSRGLKSGVQKAFLLKKNTVVIQYIPSTESQNSQGTQTINTIAEYLEQNSRRFIPEYEIALAIVHCSIQKYCNPDYKVISNMVSSTSTLQDSESVIVENTSALNVQMETDRESCDLFILETEPSQVSGQELVLKSKQIDVKAIVFNEKDSTKPMMKPSTKKKRMCNVLSSDSDSEAEPRAKKTYIAQPVVEEKQLKASNTSNQKFVSKQSSYKALNITLSKTPQLVQNLRSRKLTDSSEDEDDLFNFGDDTPLSAATKRKRVDFISNEFHASRPSNLKKHSTNGNDVDENDNDSISTQPFIPKSITESTPRSLLKAKILPETLSTEGWKTFSGKNKPDTSVKTEAYSQQNTDVKIKYDWYNSESFKSGFRFKVKPFNLPKVEDLSIAKSGGSSHGFKKFVKQKLLQH